MQVMKSAVRKRFTIALTAASLLGLASVKADVIIGDAAIAEPFGPPNDYLVLTTSPGGLGLFAYRITDLGSGAFELAYAGIAEENALYAATAGQAITPAFATSAPLFTTNDGIGPGAGVLSFTLGETKLLAYWDDRSIFDGASNELDGAPDAGDFFGWAELTWNGSTLAVTDSATATADGILAGTYNQIPEPGTLALLATALGALIATRRRSR